LIKTEVMDRKKHWENIYNTKELDSVSWYQPTPQTSLDLIEGTGIDKNASIIDIGGGDSFLVDHLLKAGYTNVTVLDISEKAIERAKQRLSDKASFVDWIVSDITEFQPEEQYDVWHDRAAFHFLTSMADVDQYKKVLSSATKQGSSVVIGTFSDSGPLKCSGIEIKQYSESEFLKTFNDILNLQKLVNVDHPTPFDTIQNFNFGVFVK